MPVSEPRPYLYDAFISYRHAEPDRRWAKWLHGALETYRVPRRLVRDKGVPSRLQRVFRDEEEVPASANLGKEIETALEASKFLIVVCSPRTPQSEWVNREIERFREMGRGDQILALLIEGAPTAAFPRSLREIRRRIAAHDGSRHESIEEVEPLAADVRASRGEPQSRLKRAARLRLLACILGCRFDDLRQRDQERRVRQLSLLVSVAALLLLGFAALTAAMLLAQREARENLLQSQWEQYRSGLSEAMAHLGRGSSESARRALDRCPPTCRGWEFDYIGWLAKRARTLEPVADRGTSTATANWTVTKTTDQTGVIVRRRRSNPSQEGLVVWSASGRDLSLDDGDTVLQIDQSNSEAVLLSTRGSLVHLHISETPSGVKVSNLHGTLDLHPKRRELSLSSGGRWLAEVVEGVDVHIWDLNTSLQVASFDRPPDAESRRLWLTVRPSVEEQRFVAIERQEDDVGVGTYQRPTWKLVTFGLESGGRWGRREVAQGAGTPPDVAWVGGERWLAANQSDLMIPVLGTALVTTLHGGGAAITRIDVGVHGGVVTVDEHGQRSAWDLSWVEPEVNGPVAGWNADQHGRLLAAGGIPADATWSYCTAMRALTDGILIAAFSAEGGPVVTQIDLRSGKTRDMRLPAWDVIHALPPGRTHTDWEHGVDYLAAEGGRLTALLGVHSSEDDVQPGKPGHDGVHRPIALLEWSPDEEHAPSVTPLGTLAKLVSTGRWLDVLDPGGNRLARFAAGSAREAMSPDGLRIARIEGTCRLFRPAEDTPIVDLGVEGDTACWTRSGDGLILYRGGRDRTSRGFIVLPVR